MTRRYPFSARLAAARAAVDAHRAYEDGAHVVTLEDGRRVGIEYWTYVINAAVRELEQHTPMDVNRPTTDELEPAARMLEREARRRRRRAAELAESAPPGSAEAAAAEQQIASREAQAAALERVAAYLRSAP